MRLVRADALDAMVDGADAGREKQPFRRVHGDEGIEDRGTRYHKLMPQHLLDPGALVGDAGDVTELAAGDRGGHADLAHERRLHRRGLALAAPDRVDALDGSDIVREANLPPLGAFPDRTTPPPDAEIGPSGPGPIGRRNDC